MKSKQNVLESFWKIYNSLTDSELKARIIAHFLGQDGDLLSYLVIFNDYLHKTYYGGKEGFVFTPTYDQLLLNLSSEKLDFAQYIQYRRVLSEIVENFK